MPKEWAEEVGISRGTAYRWFRLGVLPVSVHRVDGGRLILVEASPMTSSSGRTVCCARVSSHDQKGDLDRQVARITTWATTNHLSIDEVVTEVGSAMNGKRRKFMAALADENVRTIVVEHRDRLARFGVEYLEAVLSAQGRSIVVVDDTDVEDDLVRDITEVLTSFCARLYGRRGARNRAVRALVATKDGQAA
jgi:putative resolvase